LHKEQQVMMNAMSPKPAQTIKPLEVVVVFKAFRHEYRSKLGAEPLLLLG